MIFPTSIHTSFKLGMYRISNCTGYRILPDSELPDPTGYRILPDTGFYWNKTGYRILCNCKVDDVFVPKLGRIYRAVRLLLPTDVAKKIVLEIAGGRFRVFGPYSKTVC